MTKAADTTKRAGKRGKGKAIELVAQSDPQAPLNGPAFLRASRPVLAKLTEDLLQRAQSSPGVQAGLAARHAAEVEDRRTGDPYPVWQRRFVGQVADAWLLSCVFARILEDRGLLGRNRLAGPGAVDSQKLFLELGPSLTERDYLLLVFRELARFPAARSLFDPRHNPVWKLGPSAAGARALLELFRTPDAAAPGFRFGQADTRFLGDLYQDLDEEVRDRYALLQTPRFVESFILDRTLEPAIERFGLDDTTIIDPTCGSGHFLLGAFERLCDHQLRARPSMRVTEAADRALAAVAGTDLNPYAVAIAKFRLTLAYLEKVGSGRLKDAPELRLNVAVADSLLQVGTQTDFADRPGQKGQVWRGEELALENEEEAKAVLGRSYTAVVGNPPYITVSDEVLRQRYREIYPDACHRLYQLVAPFIQRFFQLARESGSVGTIVGNGFMKREFGRPLIEKVLSRYNLTAVVNSSGAFVPGHGTPTALLFATAEEPRDEALDVVLAKRGEPQIPDDPETGLVWTSIRDHWATPGYEDDYISVARFDRKVLRRHPWSLGGGGAVELKTLIEKRCAARLGQFAVAIGRSTHTGEDQFFFMDAGSAHRNGISKDGYVPLVKGEQVRDWTITDDEVSLFPYDKASADAREPSDREGHLYWTYRAALKNRQDYGQKIEDRGLRWFEHSMFFPERFLSPRSIAFAFVATHNHFVFDRGGKVFKQTAPVIKLTETATEEDHLALLAYLNSSTACFLLKQTCFDKGNRGEGGGTTSEAWERFFEFTAAGVGQLPVPTYSDELRELLIDAASSMDKIASTRAGILDVTQILANATACEEITAALADRERLLRANESLLRGLQERVDWLVYVSVGLCSMADVPAPASLEEGARASDVLFARAVMRGSAGRRYFALCRLPDPSLVGSPEWLNVNNLRERVETIERSPELLLLESPEFKRTFREGFRPPNWCLAAQTTILDLIEKRWEGVAHPLSLREVLRSRNGAEPLVEWMRRQDGAAGQSLDRLIAANAIPYLSSLRLSETGESKYRRWCDVWDAQRREDAGQAVDGIPPLPRYDVKDFRDPNFFRLRGKLDVPKERFIRYTGCESDQDGEPVYGWAGWNHVQRAQALTTLYQRRKTEEAWGKERLVPMLAGLLDLIPWVKQWHNEPSEEFGGLRLGDYFETFLAGECRELGLTAADLRAWRPPAQARSAARKAVGWVAAVNIEVSETGGHSPRLSLRADGGRGRKKRAKKGGDDSDVSLEDAKVES